MKIESLPFRRSKDLGLPGEGGPVSRVGKKKKSEKISVCTAAHSSTVTNVRANIVALIPPLTGACPYFFDKNT